MSEEGVIEIIKLINSVRDEIREYRRQDKEEAEAIRQQDKAEAETIRQQDKAEAEAIRQQDKAELEAIRQQDKAELEAIRQRDREEVIAMIKKCKEEGRIETQIAIAIERDKIIDAIYEQTEKIGELFQVHEEKIHELQVKVGLA